jgi:hypothetical protein
MTKPIQVFSRHCFVSAASQGKARPAWFSREACLANLVRTAESELVDIHFVYDAHAGPISSHYLAGVPNVKIFDGGTEAQAFLALLDYICSKQLPDDAIVYIVEDDYLHRPGWCHILLIDDASYITLYDHPDKYFPYYHGLRSRIRIGRYNHWRTTPSTTNTFAARYGILQRDLDVHRACATGFDISKDHERFMILAKERDRVIYSAIPSFSTHVETEHLAPLVDWERISSSASLVTTAPAFGRP